MHVASDANTRSPQTLRELVNLLLSCIARFPPYRVFLVLGGINAILLTFLTPPFQIHDEFQHFFRSYQLTQGDILGDVRDGQTGGVLPSSLIEFVKQDWGTLRVWHVPPLGEHPLTKTWREFDRPLAPQKQQFVAFLTPIYSPLLYLPQTFGIALGRLFGLSPLALMYLGRLCNALAAVGVMTLALRLLPVGRAAALAVALLPMSQFEYGSVAPDAMIIACAFLYTAIVLRASLQRTWRMSDIVLAAAAAAVVCSVKIVYAPLLAIGVPSLLSSRHAAGDHAKRRLLLAANLGVAVVALGSAAVWLHLTSHTMPSLLTPARRASEITLILTHPIRFTATLLADVWINGLRYIIDSIGVFGAWTVFLPPYVYEVGLLSVLLSWCVVRNDDARLGRGAIVWGVLMWVGVVALIQTAMFILNTPTGEWTIDGVGGRYFLPIGALASALITSVTGRLRSEQSALCYAILLPMITFDTVAMDVTIVQRFHLF